MANMPRCLQNNDRGYSRRNGRAHHKNDSRSKAATAGRQECRPSKPLSKSRVQVVKVEPRCVIEALSQTPGVEVLPEKDAEHEAGIKAEFGEWHAHWQVGLKVQERGKAWSSGSKRKPWPHSKDGCAQEVLRRVRVPRWVGKDGFHPRVPMDLSDLTSVVDCWRSSVHTLTCCTHIFLHIARAQSHDAHFCLCTLRTSSCVWTHTHGSSVWKGLLHAHVAHLHLAFSILMCHPPSLLFPDGHFETTFPTLTSTTSLPSFTRPKSAGQAHFRTSAEEFGYLAKCGPHTG